jgi:hypothetical protein
MGWRGACLGLGCVAALCVAPRQPHAAAGSTPILVAGFAGNAPRDARRALSNAGLLATREAAPAKYMVWSCDDVQSTLMGMGEDPAACSNGQLPPGFVGDAGAKYLVRGEVMRVGDTMYCTVTLQDPGGVTLDSMSTSAKDLASLQSTVQYEAADMLHRAFFRIRTGAAAPDVAQAPPPPAPSTRTPPAGPSAPPEGQPRTTPPSRGPSPPPSSSTPVQATAPAPAASSSSAPPAVAVVTGPASTGTPQPAASTAVEQPAATQPAVVAATTPGTAVVPRPPAPAPKNKTRGPEKKSPARVALLMSTRALGEHSFSSAPKADEDLWRSLRTMVSHGGLEPRVTAVGGAVAKDLSDDGVLRGDTATKALKTAKAERLMWFRTVYMPTGTTPDGTGHTYDVRLRSGLTSDKGVLLKEFSLEKTLTCAGVRPTDNDCARVFSKLMLAPAVKELLGNDPAP